MNADQHESGSFAERLGAWKSRGLAGQEAVAYPVLRHHSIMADANRRDMVYRSHTAETVILYVADLGEGCLFIDRGMLAKADWSEEYLHDTAIANLRKLNIPVKTQQVGRHAIHFVSPTDGYAASRILLPELLEKYDRSKQGQRLGVAIPHQDVLILADIADDQGTKLLARLTYDFATKGDVPICPVPFLYADGQLDLYLVLPT